VDAQIRSLLRLSLDEDIGAGDVTTQATVDPEQRAVATVLTREPCVACGVALFEPLVAEMRARDSHADDRAPLELAGPSAEGEPLGAGQTICTIRGSARGLLTIERTFLNFLGRLSGIATVTRAYVDAARAGNARVRVLDTRKTTPGHRTLERYAVRCGGGSNHRMGLYDAILIKDNHVIAAGGVEEAVRRALQAARPGMSVEVECDRLEQIETALRVGARAILLDNFTPRQVADAVRLIGGRARVEVSGGVSLDTIAAFAVAGPDDISVGRLTHSARAIDVSLDMALA
jgi:nicotinate-nucleotide pyrophosphorylase (carboxylating)